MTKITYLPPAGDAAECLWGGYLFEADVPLEVSSRHILAKAAANPHFRVEDAPAKPAKPAKAEKPAPAEAKPAPDKATSDKATSDEATS